ncbi:MAG: AsmA family protein [Acidobacteria bacterium]|nr:AsmA family protein [Acidobacteriota bacterium]
MAARHPVARRIFWIIAVLLLLGLLAPAVVSLNHWRDAVATALTESLGRPVRIGGVHLTLRGKPALEIQNVVIEEAPGFGIEPFARMESLRAMLAWPSFRGGIRFSSLVFVSPSLNVVRAESGKWNLETLWERADGPSFLPSESGTAPRRAPSMLPAIKVGSGRINFKVANQKKAYILEDADLTFVPPDTPGGPYQLRFAGTPNRVDIPFYPASRIAVEADFAPSPSPLQQSTGMPLRLKLTAEDTLLGDFLKVAFGKDYGVHGTANLEVQLTGTTSLLRFSAKVALRDLHRWDLLPPETDLPLEAQMEGLLDLSKDSLQLMGSVPVGDGSIYVEGRVEKLFLQPQPFLHLRLQGVPASAVVQIAKQFTTRLASDFQTEGILQGSLEVDGGAEQLRGMVNVVEGRIRRGEMVVGFSDFPIAVRGKSGVAGPWKAELKGKQDLTGSFSWNLEATIYRTRLEGEHLSLVELLRWATVFGGLRTGAEVSGGDLSFQAQITAGGGRPTQTRGWAEVSGGIVNLPDLNQPVSVKAARLEFQDGEIRARSLAAELGSLRLEGSIMVKLPPQLAESPADLLELPLVEFDCRTDQVDLAELASALNSRKESFFWKQRIMPSSAWFTAMRAKGRLQAGRLSYRGLEIRDFDATVGFQYPILEIKNFAGEFAGGRHAGQASVQFGPDIPSFALTTRYENMDLDQLSRHAPSWTGILSGKVDGALRLASSGWNWEEMRERIGGSGEMKGKHLTLHGFVLSEPPAPSSGAHTPIASLATNFQISKQELLLRSLDLTVQAQAVSRGKRGQEWASWLVSGTVGFDQRLNLRIKNEDGELQYHWGGTLPDASILERAVSRLAP